MKQGVYQHYKGNEYWVEREATHSETEETLVVYQCLYGDYSWWVRPSSMFSECIEKDGQNLPRFKWIRETI